jgi:ADP-heptose:LPS heptosyltransferase
MKTVNSYPMKILISNPDSFGDMVLREPLFRALHETGHSVALVVSEKIAPVVPYVAPHAESFIFRGDPYSATFSEESDEVLELMLQVELFKPDIFVVASYQWTSLEEFLGTHVKCGSIKGFKGRLYRFRTLEETISNSRLPVESFLDIPENFHEVKKNQAMALALPGVQSVDEHPRLVWKDDLRSTGLSVMEPRILPHFWVVSVGSIREKDIRNWPQDKWADLFRHVIQRHQGNIVLVGDQNETPLEFLRLLSDLPPGRIHNLHGQTPHLKQLLEVIALSSGYIGRDTGVLHMAAAMQKPVFAVYGGGDWPRFTPSGENYFAVTSEIICRPCNWICPFETSHCIKDIPVSEVIRAFDSFATRNFRGQEILEIPHPPSLWPKLIQESVRQAKQSRFFMERERVDYQKKLAASESILQKAEEDLLKIQACSNQLAEALQSSQHRLKRLRKDPFIGPLMYIGKRWKSWKKRLEESLRERFSRPAFPPPNKSELENLAEFAELLIRRKWIFNRVLVLGNSPFLISVARTLSQCSKEVVVLNDASPNLPSESGLSFVHDDLPGFMASFPNWLLERESLFVFDAQSMPKVVRFLPGRMKPGQGLLTVGTGHSGFETCLGEPHSRIGRIARWHTAPVSWLSPAVFQKERSPRRNQRTAWSNLFENSPVMPSGSPWPKISIVTPTFNQGHFIEETIRSVLGQNYPHLEFIVMDGGSKDATCDILRRYHANITHWESEKDRGQSHALNKGFALATGDILTWLNSDDLLAENALHRVAVEFEKWRTDMIVGACWRFTKSADNPDYLHRSCFELCAPNLLPLKRILDLEGEWLKGSFFHQPEVFFSRELFERTGGCVREDLFYSMDYDLWVRFAASKATLVAIPEPLAYFRLHENQKTGGVNLPFLPELKKVHAEHLQRYGR